MGGYLSTKPKAMGSTPVPEVQRYKQNALLSMWPSGLIIKAAACALLSDPEYREYFDSVFTSLRPVPE